MKMLRRFPRLAYFIGACAIWGFVFSATSGYGLAVFFADLLTWQVVFLALSWGILAGLGLSHLLRVWESLCGLGVDTPG